MSSRLIAATVVVAATFVVPAVAQAEYSKDTRHENRVLRAKVVRLGGDPGRDIIRYGRRPGKDSSVREYFATLRRMVAPVVAAPVVQEAAAQTSSSVASAPVASVPSSGGGGCGDLPAYIVQRESGSLGMSARNGRYGGCAQVDDAHFGAGGACAGLAYIPCVNKLWDHGRGASNWPTAANPPR
jgi:hypothetical protein